MNSSTESILAENIATMNRLEGFDVVIACCSSAEQSFFWQKRLEGVKGTILPSEAVVLSVEEDWVGGAGNALGTLYAFQKACKLAQDTLGRDIFAELRSKQVSVGLYHTAGKGTRLAPLPAGENNNKPGVKLPTTIKVAGHNQSLTILEAVIKQTGCYAKSRRGRLSVFWGDQVFIPTAPVEYEVTHHVDILCSLGPMMSESEWAEKGMDKYGLIASCEGGRAAQIEKVSHSTAVRMLKNLGDITSVGVSLGSFSVSSEMLGSLLDEFSGELSVKKGKFDSDPHLWMPMTLERDNYIQLMKQKGLDEEVSANHYDRIAAFLSKFHKECQSANDDDSTEKTTLGLFGPVDVGLGVYWWDYGQLKLYQKNALMLTENTREAEMMRSFLGVTSRISDSQISGEVSVDESSLISNSIIKAGNIRNSVISGVRCNELDVENAVLINVTADKIVAKKGGGVILYNVAVFDAVSGGAAEPHVLELNDRDVLVGVFDANGNQSLVRSSLDIDGGKAWEMLVAGNTQTFDDINVANRTANPSLIETASHEAHNKLWDSVCC